MKISNLVLAAPLAALSVALLLSSCSATTAADAPVSGASATPQSSVNEAAIFTAQVTSDLKPFVDAGQTWALQNQGVTLFAGNKAVSVEKLNRSADIQVTVFNLDDGSIVGEAAVGRIAKAGASEDYFPVTQRIVRHEGKEFLALTQTGYLPSPNTVYLGFLGTRLSGHPDIFRLITRGLLRCLRGGRSS